MIEIETEMAESEATPTIVMQVAIKAGMAAVMVVREADTGPASDTNTFSSGEVCRHRHEGPALRQLSFNWNALDKYMEFLRWML